MSSPPDTRDPLDPSQIEFLVSLDDGQGEMLAEIVREYLASSEECSSELGRLLGEGDCPAIERTAHTLKGASANVGASGLVELCARLESRRASGSSVTRQTSSNSSSKNSTACAAALQAVTARV